MERHGLCPEGKQAVERVLGYLNFSTGKPDPNLLASLDLLSASVEPDEGQSRWQAVGEALGSELRTLADSSSAFQDADQASAVHTLVWHHALPAYLAFHEDLLFHQQDGELFNAFFVGRVCEAVLLQGGPWDEVDRIVDGALKHLNDYLGYRPIAVLESHKIEPYPHERSRPVPLYIRDAGVVSGEYFEVVTRALKLLEKTDQDLLRNAYLDLEALDELAIDPRAYDFDHPVNKRPNYHFGQWDPDHIDNRGRYTRFVIQQVTLDGLMDRLTSEELPEEESLVEAASVLAGVVLMASGISGSGPDSHDSTTSLTSLLPRIAGYRDGFYERLLSRVEPAHAERLLTEAAERRQPFGSARQHLNAQLARRRASQLEHVQLAKLYARMGYTEAAEHEANIVPTASARLLCQIDCRLTSARAAIVGRAPHRAAELLVEIVETLHRGIGCGAIVDPWNILGFDSQFSLFPAIENSVHDHRIDDLIALMEEVFAIFSQAWAEAAARDETDLCETLARRFHELVEWWRQFAAHEMSIVEAIDPLDAYHAAEHVAGAINLWHKGGAEAGDIGFWAPHANMFDSAQAYALVIQALLGQKDCVAARALLIHWLSEAERVPLEQAECSFYRLAETWLLGLRQLSAEAAPPDSVMGHEINADIWRRVSKFFDYLEANADSLWQTPSFELSSVGEPKEPGASEPADPFPDDDEEDDLFRAAYEDVVYHDSADDGHEGEIFDTGSTTEDELVREADRLCDRLAFIHTLARLWRSAALCSLNADCGADVREQRCAALRHWSEKLQTSRSELMELLDQVSEYRIAASQSDHDSMIEYDRRRMVKEGLLDRIVASTVEIADADRILRSTIVAEACGDDIGDGDLSEETLAVRAFAAILRSDQDQASRYAVELIAELSDQALLYVPLTKGGSPRVIVETRVRQQSIQDLLRCLPRLGLYVETYRLIETARDMERNNPVGAGAVTEFDELFKIGYKSLVRSLVSSASEWQEERQSEHRPPNLTDSPLIACLEQLTEAALHSWLAHSQTLRLSVLEKVSDKRSWEPLVSFVEDYGADLFTQRFLNLGNIRAILHQGVQPWLERVVEESHGDVGVKLLDELLDDSISSSQAARHLTLVLEAITENYGEYRDYNSTTTQSDRGELLYTLLDFLRLRTKYDRVCWNLKPVVWAHEILVRRGCKQAAQMWRRALRERIDSEADKFAARLKKLQKKHAMQMPSIADRLGERFVRPLIIDRLCSLVEPAIADVQADGPKATFRMLQYETEFLTKEPTGVGFDLPPWLVALEDEVQRASLPEFERDDFNELEVAVPMRLLSQDEVLERLDEWTGD
ncbi:MAG: hypothetical protein CMJ64_29140 [Planctomycetaceae bacterium]|nr:hypothetical protein [Planctomycetaceae bacterium]